MKKQINILSYGAGTQSTALLLMYLNGELDIDFDYIIFANTGFDKRKTKVHLQNIINLANQKSKTIHIADYKNLKDDYEEFYKNTEIKRVSQIPFYTETGLLMRQCTTDYKIKQILRKIRELEDVKTLRGYTLNMYLGISIDEIHRAKQSDENELIQRKYPLIDKKMDRQDCILYAIKHLGYQPPSSECIICPFQTNDKWLDLKLNYPEEWEYAVKFDNMIRNDRRLRQKCYLHKNRKPLDECDIQENQISLFDNHCDGFCGL